MYIALSGTCVIGSEDIIGIFDMDSATVAKRTRDTLEKAEKKGQVITAALDLPKSFIVCAGKEGGQTVYLSPLTPGTVIKRMKITGNRL